MEDALLVWFQTSGRDLPWRRTRDPYAILVSEVMLQQTQVDRVVPRYLAWLQRWPTVDALAAASPADVIREWQGLGYNRRGLNLHRAARRVAADGWPQDLTELPGVGAYTAAAVANFAFGRNVLPIDTVPRCAVCPLADECPSRGQRYEPLRKQSRFEGSFRQRRADVLRLVAESPRRATDLDAEAMSALEADGLIERFGAAVRLPE